VNHHTSADGIRLVARAADFAARAHARQRRKGEAQEPYLNHLAEVAALLAEATGGREPELIAAGWLHDALEDTATDRATLLANFGDAVCAIVAEVTDDKSLPKAERKMLQVTATPSKSVSARLLKLADLTSNLRSNALGPPVDWSLGRRAEYIDWAEAVAAGCRGLNAALERQFEEAAGSAMAALSVPDGIAARLTRQD
jgi:(p)ppGpp synthase/HD superfamily hydrolase